MENFINKIKAKNPLIHCITNYVTANDVANALLAIGASPIMADEPEEAYMMSAISNGLVVNLGTLNKHSIEAMKSSLVTANLGGIATVLDPVGVGANKFRTNIANELLKNYKFSVIRGNISEIKALDGLVSQTKGVDANEKDEECEQSKVDLAKSLSQKTNAVVVISGKIDVICYKNRAFICENGDAMMKDITGSGCMLSALIAAFCSVSKDLFEASLKAVVLSGVAGELARKKTDAQNGANASFRNNFIDEIYKMDDEKLEKFARFSEI
ncbi:hydroxyethylthiazole kinase [Campylobacter geochelonis]|uniref:Hydroxyethylthiazole kinase n=1 Tax=Campylobacter geochelonis TaxID=1780362 RepID=A0A128EGL8_9BACT|nr:hydroxyethylthiazole kinase [Campylobacter geochelonis]QKF71995.1 hydroxyethylthiazole kinase [Campylobacter geochelonis]CZE47721.1 hydroxyethylthiazole kinase [Campylobacter geochelonis]CZE48950.1 hydroxyethylthiazole kinase [Campylobacter geochelonis]